MHMQAKHLYTFKKKLRDIFFKERRIKRPILTLNELIGLVGVVGKDESEETSGKEFSLRQIPKA